MSVNETRVSYVATLGLAAAALVASVAGGFLLAAAAPYLALIDLWAPPLTGAAYAGAAAYVAWSRPRLGQPLALVLVSVGLAAPALSLGLAQYSPLWVGIGALAGIVVPAVGRLCVSTLRGEGSGALELRLLRAAGVLVVAIVAARVLALDPAAWGWCRCASNPFAVTRGPGTYESLQPWLTGTHLVAVGLVMIAVALSFLRRPGRRDANVIALMAGLVLSAATWVVEDAADLAGAPMTGTVPGMTVGMCVILAAYVVGLSRRRPSRAHVADLLLAARERSDPARLRELVARAVGDAGAIVYWWDRDSAQYVDHAGRYATADVDVVPERVLEVESGGRPIARVVTELDLVDDSAIRGTVAEALRLSTENRFLQEELARSLAEVRESRTRIVQASDEARRRIERDLHDGAQQLLISTGAKLNLASTRVDATKDPELAGTLSDASDELGRALVELRSLARGITPTALVHGSLPDALEDLALRCPVPTTLHVEGVAEVDAEVAATAYFVVAECLANVAKHAESTAVQIDLDLGHAVRVRVCDDGQGGADPSTGTGLDGLADRVAAQGGSLEIVTSIDGTTVIAALPSGQA